MDPIHPILPTSPNISSVNPTSPTARVVREHRRQRDPGKGARDGGRWPGRGKDFSDRDGEGFGEDKRDPGGQHVDVTA